MSEVSSWSETDESNTAAPPNGWPEFMNPSDVNNCARAMMGAIKRWYNTVSAGIANCLPLSGGILTGALQVPLLTSTGNINATGSIGAGTQLSGSTLVVTTNAAIGGNLSALNIGATAQLSGATLAVTGNGTLGGSLGASSLHATGDISADGNIGAGAQLSGATLVATGNATLGGSLAATSVHATGAISADGNIGAGAQLSGATLVATTNAIIGGNLTANGLVVNTTANVGGALTANSASLTGALTANSASLTGALTANSASLTGNLTANSASLTGTLTASVLVNTITYQLAGVNFAYRGSDVAGPLNTICDPTGFPAIDIYGVNGTYYRCDNAHSFTNRAANLNICRFQSDDGNCINASGLWNVVSDGAVKENIAPYRAGLAEVLQLEPVSYRYTDDAPFGADGQLRYGLIAQDVEPILPEMITHAELSRAGSDEPADFATMAPGHLVFVLVNAVKEMAAKNAALEARLVSLEEGHRHV